MDEKDSGTTKKRLFIKIELDEALAVVSLTERERAQLRMYNKNTSATDLTVWKVRFSSQLKKEIK